DRASVSVGVPPMKSFLIIQVLHLLDNLPREAPEGVNAAARYCRVTPSAMLRSAPPPKVEVFCAVDFLQNKRKKQPAARNALRALPAVPMLMQELLLP
ncbi:MAG: hypothetical protein IJT18_04905, partial [Oscillospiraceae bacterium]|nr:hypothetical protein [Oscillospiraceae bacterium]